MEGSLVRVTLSWGLSRDRRAGTVCLIPVSVPLTLFLSWRWKHKPRPKVPQQQTSAKCHQGLVCHIYNPPAPARHHWLMYTWICRLNMAEAKVGRRAALRELGTTQIALPWTTLQLLIASWSSAPLTTYNNLGFKCPIVSELYVCPLPSSLLLLCRNSHSKANLWILLIWCLAGYSVSFCVIHLADQWRIGNHVRMFSLAILN